MQATTDPIPEPGSRPASAQPPFGVNEVRLGARQWLWTLAIVVACVVAAPKCWRWFEPMPIGPDDRIPYALSKDYWLYRRRLDRLAQPGKVVLLGDSVVWGEYVRPDGTLSHFLNQQDGPSDRFVNGGVNGLFPMAMEGLVDSYGGALRGRQVLVHCNLLWMSSPKADLSTDREERFNHSRLVPQFSPRIPCYRADADERLSAVFERHVDFLAWVGHLQSAYYDQRSIPRWTLEEDGSDPPRCPNAWRNPLSPLASGIPREPGVDPLRGPGSPRHEAWNAGRAEPMHFEWVDPDRSLQWQAFRRAIETLRRRGNSVLVVLGPFNEAMIAEDQRPTYRTLRDHVATWLRTNNVPVVVPEPLPSELYADASHPLTEGYAMLAVRLFRMPLFREWLAGGPHKALGHLAPGCFQCLHACNFAIPPDPL